VFDRHAGYELQWNSIRHVFMTSSQHLVSSTSDLTRPDYHVIAVCTTAGHRCSATLEPGQLSQLWTLPVSLSVTIYAVERRRKHGVAST